MSTQLSSISASTAPIADLKIDLLVAPLTEHAEASAVDGLDAATGGMVSDALARGEFRGKPFEQSVVSVVERTWGARRVVLIGAGPELPSPARIRQLAAAAVLSARQKRVARVAFLLLGSPGVTRAAESAAEGLRLGEFDAGHYKTDQDAHALSQLVVAAPGAEPEALEAAVARGALLGECENLARRLANEPGNALTPRIFAERAQTVAAGTALSVEILEPAAIEELEMGMLLGVARGSAEPPRLIVLRHEPPEAPKAPVLGLVGKGITFDSGGISLKPAESMERMKEDMTGGAAVMCAMRAISLLNVGVRVLGVVPATENLPGGRAVKPGDVLRSAAGKTVEVINTDAEGRLILGDALWYARHCGASHLVDVATLTGGCVVALGKITTGLFGTPDGWVDAVASAARTAGERVWALPVFDEYAELLRSEIADLKNTGGRPASAISAAMFLKAFAEGTPWAHLDIAGTAWSDESTPYQPKGPTGVAVRTLVELACAAAEWRAVAAKKP